MNGPSAFGGPAGKSRGWRRPSGTRVEQMRAAADHAAGPDAPPWAPPPPSRAPHREVPITGPLFLPPAGTAIAVPFTSPPAAREVVPARVEEPPTGVLIPATDGPTLGQWDATEPTSDNLSQDRPAPAWQAPVTFAGAAGVLATGLCAMLYGLPVLAHHWLPSALLIGAGLVTLGAAGMLRHVGDRRPALQRTAVALIVIVTLAFGSGLRSSVVLNGKVYLATSRTARVYQLVEQVRTDLLILTTYDHDLLAISTSDARIRLDRYDTAAAHLQTLAGRYGALANGVVPDGQLAPVVNDMKVAADYALLALADKKKLASIEDVGIESRLRAERAAFVDAVLRAGPTLAQVGGLYGIEVGVKMKDGAAE